MEYLRHARVEVPRWELSKPERKAMHERSLLCRLMEPVKENAVLEVVDNPFYDNQILIAHAAILPVEEYKRLVSIESKYLSLTESDVSDKC